MRISKYLVLLLFIAGSGWAQTNGELLVTAVNKGLTTEVVFELLNEGEIVGAQFEIEFSGVNAKAANTDACLSGVGGAISVCTFVGNTLKVAVLDGSLNKLPTGEMGRISLKGGFTDMQVKNAKLADAYGKERSVEALVERQGFAGFKPSRK